MPKINLLFSRRAAFQNLDQRPVHQKTSRGGRCHRHPGTRAGVQPHPGHQGSGVLRIEHERLHDVDGRKEERGGEGAAVGDGGLRADQHDQ